MVLNQLYVRICMKTGDPPIKLHHAYLHVFISDTLLCSYVTMSYRYKIMFIYILHSFNV